MDVTREISRASTVFFNNWRSRGAFRISEEFAGFDRESEICLWCLTTPELWNTTLVKSSFTMI
jgi:hypothetical protein